MKSSIVHLKTMTQLQDGVNLAVNPNWIAAGNEWGRAIWLECAELMDHLGWKWWKAQEPNIPQAHIELIDIWHFVLSHTLVQHGTNAAQALHDQLSKTEPVVVFYDNDLRRLDELSPRQKIDVFASLAATGTINVRLFDAIREELHLSWDELYRTYLGKNILNQFRQQNGYKQGTYIKMWAGQEDNVFLERVMEANPHITTSELYATLRQEYANVVRDNVGSTA